MRFCFLLLLGLCLPGMLQSSPLEDFRSVFKRTDPNLRPPWPPDPSILQAYQSASLVQRMQILRNWSSGLSPSAEQTVVVRGTPGDLGEFVDLFSVSILKSLDRLGVLIVRVPTGYSRSEFMQDVKKSLPGLQLERDFSLAPEKPAEGSPNQSRGPSRLLDMDSFTEFLNDEFGLARRKIKVAVLDTGCGPHPDLTPRRKAMDPNGHGTHVSGILAATRKNGLGIDGVSANVHLNCYSVLGPQGTGQLSTLISSLSLAELDGNEMILMSLGTKERSRLLHEVLDELADTTFLVAAAGNESTTEPILPASHPLVVGVGSVDREGQLSPFSNHGRNLNVSTHGEDILSLWKNGATKSQSGTSMAAPAIAGLFAEILARLPSRMRPVHILEALSLAVRTPIRNDPDPRSKKTEPETLAQKILERYRQVRGLKEP